MYKWISKKKNQKGFTLIELIVVIAILGILAAIAVPRFMGATEKAKQSAHDSNVAMIESAAELALVNGTAAGDITIAKLVDDGFLSNTPTYGLVANTVYTVEVTSTSTDLGNTHKITVLPAKGDYVATTPITPTTP